MIIKRASSKTLSESYLRVSLLHSFLSSICNRVGWILFLFGPLVFGTEKYASEQSSMCLDDMRMPRYFDSRQDFDSTFVPVSRLSNSSRFLEGYFYIDDPSLQKNSNLKNNLSRILQQLKLTMDEYFTWLTLNGSQIFEKVPLMVLFDDIRDEDYYCSEKKRKTQLFRGYFDSRFFLECKRDVLVLDYHQTTKLQFTFVHELSHLLRNKINPEEERWLEEGLSLWIELKFMMEKLSINDFGNYSPQLLSIKYDFPVYSNPEWASDPCRNDRFRHELSNHSLNSFLFFHYLRSHFGGDELIKQMLTSQLSGIQNLYSSITEENKNKIWSLSTKIKSKDKTPEKLFEGIVLNYFLALGLNRQQDVIKSKYNLWNLNLQSLSASLNPKWGFKFYSFDSSSIQELLPKWSARFLSLVDSRCIQYRSTEPLYFYIFDVNSRDKNKVFYQLDPNKRTCFKEFRNREIYIINASDLDVTYSIE